MTDAIDQRVALLLTTPQPHTDNEGWTVFSHRSLAQVKRRGVRQRVVVALGTVVALCIALASLWRVLGPVPASQAPDPTINAAAAVANAVPRLGDVLPEFAAVFVPRLLVVALVIAGVVVLAVRYRKKRVARPLGVISKVAIGIAIALVGLTAAWIGAVDVWFVATESMAPTLRVQDRVWVDESDTAVQRGDVVLFVSDGGTVPAGTPRIARVVAVAGDAVEGSDGLVLINGQKTAWVQQSAVTPTFAATTLDADQLFIMGDNTRQSVDSRTEGPISTDQVRGTVRAIIWSTNG